MAVAKSVRSWRNIVKSGAEFFVDSRACVRVGSDASEWFLVNVRLSIWCGSRDECYGAWEMAVAAECEWWQV